MSMTANQLEQVLDSLGLAYERHPKAEDRCFVTDVPTKRYREPRNDENGVVIFLKLDEPSLERAATDGANRWIEEARTRDDGLDFMMPRLRAQDGLHFEGLSIIAPCLNCYGAEGERLLRVANRLNWENKFASFAVDPNDGELRFSYRLSLKGDQQLNADTLLRLFNALRFSMDELAQHLSDTVELDWDSEEINHTLQ